jgi:hypothetical protein
MDNTTQKFFHEPSEIFGSLEGFPPKFNSDLEMSVLPFEIGKSIKVSFLIYEK